MYKVSETGIKGALSTLSAEISTRPLSKMYFAKTKFAKLTNETHLFKLVSYSDLVRRLELFC